MQWVDIGKDNQGGVQMQDRSCKFCRWIGEKEILIGKIHWCGAKSEETKLGGYCPNFRQKKQ